MPELPEVETIRRGLAPQMENRLITQAELFRPDLRQPFPEHFTERVAGRTIRTIRRRAKYLLFELNDGQVILLHLGMSGRLLLRKAGHSLVKHDHVRLTLEDEQELVFNDARRFGLMLLAEAEGPGQHPILTRLGPEPLGNHFSAEYLAGQLARRRGPVKTALMDQKLVVGVGNIYACEVLFRCGIHPQTPADQCADQAMLLVSHIRDVLHEAIESGGSTLRDYVRSSGDMGYFQHAFRVYGRENEPCMHCSTPVLRLVQAGRSTFFLPCLSA